MGSTGDSRKVGNNGPDELDEEETWKNPSDRISTSEQEEEAKTCDNNDNKAAGATGGGGSRPRHDSTSSSDSTRSPSTDRMKRRRTTSISSSPLSTFFFPPPSTSSTTSSPSPFHSSPSSSLYATPPSPGGDGSPMTLDDVVSAVHGVTNMALAHEIALDSNFKLEKFEPPQSSIEKQVRDVMHQAFWDNLRDQLSQDPPVYTQAFVLLQEVRQQLLDLTLPHQSRLRQEITEKLDVALIEQQAKHGALDFGGYSGYVVSLMAKLCAPVRDEAIEALQRQSNVVEVFCGVVETLDLMKLDMANYTIQAIRPTIVKQIVEYERGKFKEFLKTQQDGLELTRSWILKNVDAVLEDHASVPATATAASAPAPGGTSTARAIGCPAAAAAALLGDPLALRSFCNSVLNAAYMELLQESHDVLLPETICMDGIRVAEQRDRLHQLCLLAAVQLVSLSTLWRTRPALATWQDQLREALKRDLAPILDPAYTQSETLAALPNLTEAAVCSLQTFLEARGEPPLDASVTACLRSQLKELNPQQAQTQTQAQQQQPQQRVLSLVTSRGIGFLAQILSNSNPRGLAVPAPFLVLQEEMARICAAFLRLTQHNRSVFGEFYFDMVEERLRVRAREGGSASSSTRHEPLLEKEDRGTEEKETPAAGKAVMGKETEERERQAGDDTTDRGAEESACDRKTEEQQKAKGETERPRTEDGEETEERLPADKEESSSCVRKGEESTSCPPVEGGESCSGEESESCSEEDGSCGVRWDSLDLD